MGLGGGWMERTAMLALFRLSSSVKRMGRGPLAMMIDD